MSTPAISPAFSKAAAKAWSRIMARPANPDSVSDSRNFSKAAAKARTIMKAAAAAVAKNRALLDDVDKALMATNAAAKAAPTAATAQAAKASAPAAKEAAIAQAKNIAAAGCFLSPDMPMHNDPDVKDAFFRVYIEKNAPLIESIRMRGGKIVEAFRRFAREPEDDDALDKRYRRQLERYAPYITVIKMRNGKIIYLENTRMRYY